MSARHQHCGIDLRHEGPEASCSVTGGEYEGRSMYASGTSTRHLGGSVHLGQYGPHLGFRKPLLASVGVGIILGDLPTAIMIGATMELMWLGVNNIGAYVPPDVISGTIVGAALGIMGGGDASSAIALAVAIGIPTATLVQQLNILVMTTNVSLVHAADKAVESGKFSAVNKYFWAGAACFFLTRAVPVFIATGIGSFVIEDIMNFLQSQVPWVLTGFSTAGGMMPAVGLAMLLTMMMKKNMWIFLLLGFVLAAFLGVPTVGIAIAACAAAGIWDVICEGQKGSAAPAVAASTAAPSDDDDEEYDF